MCDVLACVFRRLYFFSVSLVWEMFRFSEIVIKVLCL